MLFTMVYLNGKCTTNCHKDLKIILTRIPFNDSTNKSTMPRRNKHVQKHNAKDNAVVEIEKTSGKSIIKNDKSPKITNNSNLQRNVLKSFSKSSDNNEQACRFLKTRDKQMKPSAAHTRNMPVILLENMELGDKSAGIIASNQAIKCQKEKKSTLFQKNTPLKRRLRKCQQMNYHESTLEHSSVIEDVSSVPLVKTKVPIYKQNVTKNKPLDKQCPKDPYDLDISDSENEKPKNKKLNTSRKFNKTMYDVIEKLEKDNKRSRKKVHVTKTKPPGEYKKNINNAIKRVMKKISEKNKASTSQVENKTISSQRVSEEVVININSESNKSEKCNSIYNGSVHNTESPSGDMSFRYIETIHGYENDEGLLGFEISRKASEVGNIIKISSVSRVNIVGDVKLTSVHSTIGYDDVDSNSNYSHSDENYFGFGEDDDDMGSHSFFVKRQPNANSTMIENRSKSPWRVTTFLKRKPYLLSVKTSALPNLQQEMVLDHTIVEDIEKHYMKSISKASNPKHPIQTSILDYVESSIDNTLEHNQEDLGNSSLFNYEEFNVTKPKRRVLGTLQECSLEDRQVISTPLLRNHSNLPPNSKSNFGFDTADNEVEKENRPDTAKPYRLNLAGMNMYRNVVVSNDDFEDNSQNGSINADIPTAMEADDTDVQLFDDVDKEFEGEMSINLPKIKYQRKTRRKRLHSNASDNEEDDRPRKKKKDMMTKAEEAAFEEWAAKFNSMCEEVDQHDLEIE